MKQTEPSTVAESPRRTGLAKPAEFVEFTGVSLTKTYNLMRSGEIPTVKFGSCKRIPWAWIYEQLDAALAPADAPT